MIQIRLGVFETNSSSSHSLTLVNDELADSPVSDDELRAGVIELELASFGWEWRRLRSLSGKASYLIVDALGASYSDAWSGGEDYRDSVVDQCTDAARVVEAIERRTGCRVRIKGGDCSIDHQSHGVSSMAGDSAEQVEEFLFSNAYITTGNDNEDAPSSIPNDLGGEEPYMTGNESVRSQRR